MRHRAAVPILLVVVACGGGGPKVALRYHPPVGAVYHFGVEQHTTIGAEAGPLARMGKQQVIMRLYFTQTVKGPASSGDGTEVDVVFESITMEMPGMPSSVTGGALAGLQGLRGTLVFDDRGTVVRSTFEQRPGVTPDMARRMAAGVNAVAFGFPEQPVGQGDSWTIKSELPLDQIPGVSASTSEVARTTLTVREIRVQGSDTAVVLDVKTTFPSEPIRLASAEGSGTIKLDGDMSGHQVFSITRGAIIDGNVKGSMKMTMSGTGIASGGMTMLMDNENSIVLLPGK